MTLYPQCGGAQAGSRPKPMKRRRKARTFAGPSNRTGAQTEKKRKAGARVTALGKFAGEGKQLNDDIADEAAKAKGSGFRKQANRFACVLSILNILSHLTVQS